MPGPMEEVRVNVGFAALEMQADLGFSDTVYSLGAGIFFIGYFFFRDLTGDYATGLRVLSVAFVLGGLLALRVRVKQTAATVAAVDSITSPRAVPEHP